MNRGLKNDEIYDDIDNGLLFLETGMIVYRKEYIDIKESIFFGSYNLDVDGNGIISGYKTKEKLGFFKHGTPYYSKLGLLKLGNMDVHIMGKTTFEDKIIKYLSNRPNGRCKHLYIKLDGTLDDMRLFFLKYINNIVLTKIMWYLTRGKSVSISLEIKFNKIIYSTAHYLDGVDLDRSDAKFYKVNDFLKAYETMGLELAPAIEETKQTDYPETKDDLAKLLEPLKRHSLARGKSTTNDFTVNQYVHPKPSKILDVLKPFRLPIGGARCTMSMIDDGLMEEIKNLDVKTLYPKTTTINNLSIHDDKIIEAYNQLLTMMFDKEKYDGISIRVTKKDCDDLWFEILPCFINVRSIEYKATIGSDLCTNIKKNSDGNYIYSITDVNYIYNNEYVFSNHDKILNINISDLQTRLIDIIMDDIEDIKSPIVGQGDEVKLGNKISSELKDTGSRTQIRYDSDGTSGATLMRCYNNLLRGLPFDHIDNFDFEGDNIEMSFSQSSINKRLPDPNWVDKLTGREVLDVSELKLLEDTYNKYINTVSIRIEDDIIKLNTYYKQLFGTHISIGVLESDLKLKYEYGYRLDGNKCLAYGILSATVVPFSYMLSKKPMSIHKDINNKYSVFKDNESNMFTTIDGIKGLDSNHSEKCNIIYKSIFNKYIELGILRDELNLKQTDSTNVSQFVDVDELYADGYITQVKPERLYNIFEILVGNINHSKLDLYNRVLLIGNKYETMFSRYILDGLIHPNAMLNNRNINGMLTIPKLDILWLHR